MYAEQDKAWLHAVKTGSLQGVSCLYPDAARTYEASWWITEATRALPIFPTAQPFSG